MHREPYQAQARTLRQRTSRLFVTGLFLAICLWMCQALSAAQSTLSADTLEENPAVSQLLAWDSPNEFHKSLHVPRAHC